MAKSFQQIVYLSPMTNADTVEKYFNDVLGKVGASKKFVNGRQLWILLGDVIEYEIKETYDGGATLTYMLSQGKGRDTDASRRAFNRIHQKIKEVFLPYSASPEEGVDTPRFRKTAFSQIKELGSSFTFNANLIWGIILLVVALFFFANGMKDIFSSFSSSSSSSSSSQEVYSSSIPRPTGDPKQDASTYRRMLNEGNVQEANQFADEVRDLYMQDFVNDRGKKIDEFWEWNAKLK